ncbi:MAG: hypothetical protein V1895_03765 [Parcubacteria group bacterium]
MAPLTVAKVEQQNSPCTLHGGNQYLGEALPPVTSLRQAVLLTLAYFDAQGLAVSAFDVWFNLIGYRTNLHAVALELEQPAVRERLVEHDGYYSLRSREQVELRQLKHKVSEFKWRRARWVASLLSLVPFIESVAVCDSVALNKARQESDIDFLIVARPGRMWTARLLATSLTHVLRLRRHGRAVRDRACLSFYVTSDNLSLEPLVIAGGDLYLAHWVYTATPLWECPRPDRLELTRRLRQANAWAAQFFPQLSHGAGRTITERRLVKPWVARFSRVVQALAEVILRGKLGQHLELRLRRWQLRYMHKTAPFELKNRTCHIVINDRMLKFHEQDRRTWFRERTLTTYERLTGEQDLLEQVEDMRFVPAGLVVQPVGATLSLR